MLPELPVELHEQILEHLQDERSLRMCSLTCRGWAFFAQRHLFRKVRLDSGHRGPTSFLAILKASTAGIAVHVRELSLLGLGFAANGIPTPRLQRIIRLLVNIETLSIDDDWYSRPTFIVDYSRIVTHSLSDAVAVLFPAPTLKTLRLSKVFFKSANDLLHLLAAFPSLSSVRLANVRLSNVPERLADNARRLRIEDLSVEINTDDGILVLFEFVDRLLKPPFETHLRRIEWDIDDHVGPYVLAGATALLEAVRVSVDSLESCNIKFEADAWLRDLDISRHRKLASLVLDLRCCDGLDVTFIDQYTTLPEFLITLDAPYLRRLQLSFTLLSTRPSCDHLPWQHLDAALVSLHNKYPSLALNFRINIVVQLYERGDPIPLFVEHLPATVAYPVPVNVDVCPLRPDWCESTERRMYVEQPMWSGLLQ